MSPTLARLAVGPGTNATFYPGPKDNRDKWPGTKAYSVVVTARCKLKFNQLASQANKGANKGWVSDVQLLST